MTFLKIFQSGQVVLPAELRKRFNLTEEDYLEAEATPEGILLKPVTETTRQKAGEALVQMLSRVHAQQPTSDMSSEEQEEFIAQEVKAFREEKQRGHV